MGVEHILEEELFAVVVAREDYCFLVVKALNVFDRTSVARIWQAGSRFGSLFGLSWVNDSTGWGVRVGLELRFIFDI